MIQTAFCERFGVEHPVVQAPIGGASCPALAAAVSNAGGLGMLAGSWRSPGDLEVAVRETRARTDRPFGVNFVLAFPAAERLEVVLESGVGVVSFSWGRPGGLADRVRAHGGRVIQTVSSAQEIGRAHV